MMNEYILKFGNVNSNGRSYNHNSGWNFRYILAEDDEDAIGILYHFYLYEWERLRLGIPKRAPVGGRRPSIPLAYPLEDVEPGYKSHLIETHQMSERWNGVGST